MVVIATAAHLIAASLLFGGFVFPAFVARAEEGEPPARARTLLIWSAWIALISALLWLIEEAAEMSGRPVLQALNRPVLEDMAHTHFGRLWVWRLGLAIVLCLLVSARSRLSRAEGLAGVVLSAGLLASLAGAGHAAALERVREAHIAIYVVHILAAGAWIGSLPSLALVLARAGRDAAYARGPAAILVQRFSGLGIVSVIALAITGLANALVWVGSPGDLIGTRYGQLLLAKTVLFGLMLCLAGFNALRLTPRLTGAEDADAARALRRNAALEFAIGVVVVLLAAAMAGTQPALHAAMPHPMD